LASRLGMLAQDPAPTLIAQRVLECSGDQFSGSLELARGNTAAVKLSSKQFFRSFNALHVPAAQLVVRDPLKPSVDDCADVTGGFTGPREFDLSFFHSTFRWRCPAHRVWQRWKLYASREPLERHRQR